MSEPVTMCKSVTISPCVYLKARQRSTYTYRPCRGLCALDLLRFRPLLLRPADRAVVDQGELLQLDKTRVVWMHAAKPQYIRVGSSSRIKCTV